MQDNPIIRIEQLTKIFPTPEGELKALDDICIDIMPGDIFGIIGMSGAGKSTLVRCINFLEKPSSGRVIFNNCDLGCYTEKELRHVRASMGMIFQQFNLLAQSTVEANVRFPMDIAGVPREKAKKRVAELLEIVGLTQKAKAYPAQLSGGQKQRVAIARALSTEPKVLLCDEATSALDGATTRQILALLRDINKRLGVTIVVITHEMRVVEEICNRVAIVDNGKIAEIGAVSNIFANPDSPAAKRLVFPEGEKMQGFARQRMARIVFDGSSSFEPVFSNMILDCHATVNIMYADMRDIDGTARGQMVVQLPDSEPLAQKVLAYLRAKGLSVEEVSRI